MRPVDVRQGQRGAQRAGEKRAGGKPARRTRTGPAPVRVDWRGARQELERAFELEPNDPYCRLCYGVWLNAMGQSEEAIREMRRALEADPLSILISHSLAGAYYGAGLQD